MMKISALVEDRTRKPELESEHGLSLLLATGGGSWLFDTRQSGIAVENTGGLSAVLEAAGPKKVYGHPGLFRPRYSLRKKGKDRRIGIPLGQAVLERAGAHFSLSREVREIAPGIFLSGEIPLAPGAAPGEPFLTVRKMLKLRPDLFVDEQFLLVETGGGLVMINGCCHSGLINSLRHIRSIRPGSRIRAIVGGFHLRSASPRELERIAADLEEYGLEISREAIKLAEHAGRKTVKAEPRHLGAAAK